MTEFKVGKIVRLKSGGPLMTIRKVNEDNGHLMLEVIWMSEKGEKHEAILPSELCDPDEGMPPEMILL